MWKTYKAHGRLTLPVIKGGEIVYCEFTDQGNSLNTDDKETQDYIESSGMFKDGDITLYDTEKVETKNVSEKIKIDCTSWQEAADILKKEPYRIHHTKLKNPDAIKAEAELLNITFII